MKYLTVDASLNGTGIRDSYSGGYLEPASLAISQEITKLLEHWLARYQLEHYDGFPDEETIDKLDSEGREIAILLKKEIRNVKIEYFSDARMKKEII